MFDKDNCVTEDVRVNDESFALVRIDKINNILIAPLFFVTGHNDQLGEYFYSAWFASEIEARDTYRNFILSRINLDVVDGGEDGNDLFGRETHILLEIQKLERRLKVKKEQLNFH
jgi:hypothetical protein